MKIQFLMIALLLISASSAHALRGTIYTTGNVKKMCVSKGKECIPLSELKAAYKGYYNENADRGEKNSQDRELQKLFSETIKESRESKTYRDLNRLNKEADKINFEIKKYNKKIGVGDKNFDRAFNKAGTTKPLKKLHDTVNKNVAAREALLSEKRDIDLRVNIAQIGQQTHLNELVENRAREKELKKALAKEDAEAKKEGKTKKEKKKSREKVSKLKTELSNVAANYTKLNRSAAAQELYKSNLRKRRDELHWKIEDMDEQMDVLEEVYRNSLLSMYVQRKMKRLEDQLEENICDFNKSCPKPENLLDTQGYFNGSNMSPFSKNSHDLGSYQQKDRKQKKSRKQSR